MAYDEDLANRVREQLAHEGGVTEKAIFGGLALLLHGNMSVGLSGDELMVRVGPEATDEALSRPHRRIFDMTGRPMKAGSSSSARGSRPSASSATGCGPVWPSPALCRRRG